MRFYIRLAPQRPYLRHGYILFAVLGGYRPNIGVCARMLQPTAAALTAGLIFTLANGGAGCKCGKRMPACALVTLYKYGVGQPPAFNSGCECAAYSRVSCKRKAHSTKPTFFIALK